MKDYLLSVMNENQPGLYVCELPTGYGKTYSVANAIADYVLNQRKPSYKISLV